MSEKTKVDPGPDPSPDCPRCNYFSTRPIKGRRSFPSPYPPLDQNKIDEVLRRAFPRAYGQRT